MFNVRTVLHIQKKGDRDVFLTVVLWFFCSCFVVCKCMCVCLFYAVGRGFCMYFVRVCSKCLSFLFVCLCSVFFCRVYVCLMYCSIFFLRLFFCFLLYFFLLCLLLACLCVWVVFFCFLQFSLPITKYFVLLITGFFFCLLALSFFAQQSVFFLLLHFVSVYFFVDGVFFYDHCWCCCVHCLFVWVLFFTHSLLNIWINVLDFLFFTAF